jgi:hypothetical protein
MIWKMQKIVTLLATLGVAVLAGTVEWWMIVHG